MISLIPIDLPLRTLVSTCKVIYLARNPKDVALANFHHHRIARWIFLLKVNVSGVMFRSIPEDMHAKVRQEEAARRKQHPQTGGRPRPPAKVDVLMKPNIELSLLSGNHEDTAATHAGQVGARRPPVRARPRQKPRRLEDSGPE